MGSLGRVAGLCLVVACAVSGTVVAQTEDVLTREIRAESISQLARKLDDYVFPEMGKRITDSLAAKFARSDYDAITDFAEFGRAVTRDMFNVSSDRHLLIRYSPTDVADIRRRATLSGAEREDDTIRRRTTAARDNFGFARVEVLPGNIGFLKLNRFEQANFAAETAFATMAFLSHAETLVIDLRHNNGGWTSLVQILCSYFFAYEDISTETKLWETHTPYLDDVHQGWVLPHVPGRRFAETPVYILTSGRTYSAAETFIDALQSRGRATVVGETTRGGAHPTRGPEVLNDYYILKMPVGRKINPVTGGNWEGVGITPDVAVESGSALATTLQLVTADVIARNPDEGFLNGLGYDFLARDLLETAIFVFSENVRLHPESANVYDSLGEAYMIADRREPAVTNFRRSLDLDPGNDNAVEMLRKLGE